MAGTANKSCLQKPKRQTYPSDRNFYRPHIFITAAKRNMNSENSYFEGSAKLKAFMAEEEQAINNKMSYRL